MRLVLCVLLASLLLTAAPASAQQDTPFGPVPTETPEFDDPTGGDISRGTLYLIGAGVLVLVIGIGVMISRDARRSLPADEREALERERRGERVGAGAEREPGAVSKEARARARKHRQKVKAARKARRHNR